MNIPEINVVGVLTTARKFRISYSPKDPIMNVLYKDFHESINNKHSFPILTMKNSMRDPEVVKFVRDAAPDLVLVVGWYHMIPNIIRSIPCKGVAGIHASLLPKYRGGAPLVWAIINGEQETGLTLFYFDSGVDTGDIISQRRVPIRFEDTICAIYERIEKEGVKLLQEMIPRIAAGNAPRRPQDEKEWKIWPQRNPEDGEIKWASPTLSIYNFVRAQTKPYPGAFTFHKSKRLKIWEAKPCDYSELEGEPGEVLDVINTKTARGFLVSSRKDDVPLLVTKVGTAEIEVQDAYNYTKSRDFVIGEILGRVSS
jgi:methionyl-tRNA formyltransferase